MTTLHRPEAAPRSARLPSLRILAVLLLAFLAAGCRSSVVYFRPIGQRLVESTDRVPAAHYELRADDRDSGAVRVWCLRGEWDDPGGEREPSTYLDLGLEVENRSKQELQLDLRQLRLVSVEAGQERLADVEPFGHEPARTDGKVAVPPDSVRTAYVTFELPGSIHPGDIRSFRLRWTVTTPGERKFTDFTTFVRGRWRYSHPYYGPHWYWGIAVGYPLWHWGFHARWH